jgi:hypothetical protein
MAALAAGLLLCTGMLRQMLLLCGPAVIRDVQGPPVHRHPLHSIGVIRHPNRLLYHWLQDTQVAAGH